MPVIDFGALLPDTRGNRLEAYRFRRRRHDDVSFVLLRAAPEIVKQVRQFLRDRNAQWVDPEGLAPPDDEVRYTDALFFDGPPTTDLQRMLDLLTEVLTFRKIDELSLGLSLDFYSRPSEDPWAVDDFKRTDAGQLVHVGKYWKSDADAQERAGRELSDRLAHVARRHPTYRRADRVIAVPGTKHDFGERLARGVAKRLDLPVCTAVCDAENHSEAKEGHSSYALEPYHLPVSVDDEVVIVVDDVYRSGRTMRSVADAAWTAGAAKVLGLVGARTLRNH